MVKWAGFWFLVLGAVGQARSEVTEAFDDRFVLRIEAVVEASPDESWQQFLRIGEWWDGNHSWFGKAENFSIEPRAGGCFCETDGDRSALHMTVSYVDPGKEMRLIGGLGPLQGLALNGAMSWQFLPEGDGGTRIIHSYRVAGHMDGGLSAFAPIVDGVQSIQISRLKAILSR